MLSHFFISWKQTSGEGEPLDWGYGKKMKETSGEGGPLDWGYGKKDEGLLEAPTRANLLINAGDSQSPSRFQAF